MKLSNFSRSSRIRSGFTLVELLVVIGIIAILAGVLFSAGGAAIRAAQRAKMSQVANSIQTAALNYYSEYNAYPIPTGAAANVDYSIADTDTGDWKPFIIALCGNIDPATPSATPIPQTVSNTRNISFLSLKPGDLVTGTDAPKNLFNPTAAQKTFNIVIDSDYDNIVGDTSTLKLIDFVQSKVGAAPTVLPNGATTGVAVWADCNTVASGSKTWNPTFVVHTY